MKDSSQLLIRFAFRFFSGTALSKISGLIRDMTMAFFLGTSPSLAAFLIAFRFVYLARRLFGESLFHQGFIPHFEEKRKQDPKKGALFFRDLFWTLALFLGLFLLTAFLILSAFSTEVARLSSLMLPGIFFLCLFGFCTGLLQSEKSFFIPSVSPVISNVVWIAGIFFLRDLAPSQTAFGLAITLSIAFFFQWMMTLPKIWGFLKKYLSFKDFIHPSFFSSEIRTFIRPLFFGMIGIASVQINSAMDGIFARFASLEGPAYLWYAIRLQQLPLALFGLAFSSALLPSLSRAFEQKDHPLFFHLLSSARKQTFALTFPCVVGIFVLGLSSINLLFGRGDFSGLSIQQSTLCLWGYGLGLFPMAMVQIYAPAFYARKDYRTPMFGFIISTLLNLSLNALFVFYFHLGPASIALSTSISSIVNWVYLSYYLKKPKESWFSSWKVAFCSLLAGGTVMILGKFFLNDSSLILLGKNLFLPRDFKDQIVHFSGQTVLFFLLFFTLCSCFKAQDITRFYSSKLAQRKSTS